MSSAAPTGRQTPALEGGPVSAVVILAAGEGSVRARLDALEDEVQELRQLNRRIAELTDVVVELLVPLQDRDEERVREVLEHYRANI